jgi:hypothetical protein
MWGLDIVKEMKQAGPLKSNLAVAVSYTYALHLFCPCQ